MTFAEYYYYYYYHRYSCQHPCGILPTKSIENNGCVPYHLQFLIWALYTISWKACVSCITSLSELHIYPWAHTLPHPHFLKPPIPLPSNIHPFYLLPLHPIYDIIICFPFRPTTPFLPSFSFPPFSSYTVPHLYLWSKRPPSGWNPFSIPRWRDTGAILAINTEPRMKIICFFQRLVRQRKAVNYLLLSIRDFRARPQPHGFGMRALISLIRKMHFWDLGDSQVGRSDFILFYF